MSASSDMMGEATAAPLMKVGSRAPSRPSHVIATATERLTQADGSHRLVLHAVGPITQSVFGFLSPVVRALADDGARQLLLLHEDKQQRHLLDQLDPRIELFIVPAGRHSGSVRWLSWLRMLKVILGDRPVTIVHAHGLIPAMLALRGVQQTATGAKVYCSPHGSRGLGRRDALGLGDVVLKPLIRQLQRRVIANSALDARHLARAGRGSAAAIENPVQAAYFETRTAKAEWPLIASGVYDDPEQNAARFAQIAVLLDDGDRDINFTWLNRVGHEGTSRLNAARIPIFDDADASTRAARVAAAWVYLVPCAVHGYAQHIAEALASGTPCVAIDTPHHRDLIRHGVTGFLFQDDAELLDRLAVLVDEPTILSAMSLRTRQVALQRFGPDQFAPRLLDRYRAD